MADKGDAQGGGEEGKDDEEPKKGCCEKYADCLLVTWQVHPIPSTSLLSYSSAPTT